MDDRQKKIEWAYARMRELGWGFASNAVGFGNPDAYFTAVGPYDGILVEALGVDRDPVVAVEKAIKEFENRNHRRPQ